MAPIIRELRMRKTGRLESLVIVWSGLLLKSFCNEGSFEVFYSSIKIFLDLKNPNIID